MSAGSPLWYLSRGTGVVLLVTFTLVVVLGILTRGGRPLPGLPRFAVTALHRNAALLSVALLGTHVGTAIADPYVPLRIVDAVVPFTASYHPLSIGLGAVSLDLFVAVVITSLLRGFLGRRAWKVVHLSVYAAWPIAVAHSIALGPDIRHGGLLWLALACVGVTVVAAAWRVATITGSKERTSNRRLVAAGSGGTR